MGHPWWNLCPYKKREREIALSPPCEDTVRRQAGEKSQEPIWSGGDTSILGFLASQTEN